MSLAVVVRHYREKRKMSISAAALACDIAPEYFGQIEDGIADEGVTIGTARKLIVGLNIPLDELCIEEIWRPHDA